MQASKEKPRSHVLRPAAGVTLGSRRIAIVDNDRRSLDAMVEMTRDLVPRAEVVWTCTDALEAVDRCLERPDELDLLVLDMSLEGLQGPSACRHIRRANGCLPILAITSFSLNRYRDKARDAGAQALASKNEETPLARAMIDASRGVVAPGFESPSLAHARLAAEPANEHLLTAREEQVLELRSHGMTCREIGDMLRISEATVRKHMQHTCVKLGVGSSTQAVAVWLSPLE